MLRFLRFALVFALPLAVWADRPFLPKPADSYFAKFEPREAPAPQGLLLQRGDRLAICGDSITEQKMYSRLLETYLTVCVPELEISVRQHGWSGETASGFLKRMKEDCLRFAPTIATTCYGMNDHRYRPFEDAIGQSYRENQTAVTRAFKDAGARVVIGSPGCVGKMPSWVKTASGTVEDLNLNLGRLRNIDIEIADAERVALADIFWPMLTNGFAARQKYGADFCIEGKDGVHPGWAGQTTMAYAFLKALGLKGEIGTFTVDLGTGRADASSGHDVVSFEGGELQLRSRKYPFCASGDVSRDDNIRAGMALVPFNADFNRLRLVVKNAPASGCRVTWGTESRDYSAQALAAGVNLAEDFVINPFTEAFKKVDDAVGAKQAYETKQMKEAFHDLIGGKWKIAEEIPDEELRSLLALRTPDEKPDREAIVRATEEKRAQLVAKVREAFVPVTHTIRIQKIENAGQ